MQNVRDLTARSGQRSDVAEAFIDWYLFLLTNTLCFVELASILQEVGDPAMGDGAAPRIIQVSKRFESSQVSGFRPWRLAEGDQ